MEELRSLIALSRTFTINYRSNPIEKVDYFFIAMVEIMVDLVELGVERNRAITKEEEENWFKGSYHLDFWDPKLKSEIYIPIINLVEKYNFFRPLK